MEVATIFLFASLVVSFFFFFFSFFCNFLARFSPSKRPKLPLPPGTLGWPYIGETFQLYSQDPNDFFASKQKRFILYTFFFFFFTLFYLLCFDQIIEHYFCGDLFTGMVRYLSPIYWDVLV